jgi:CDP-paratose 2-epimerase
MIDIVAGSAINLGGGPQNTLSVWSEFGPLLESLLDRAVQVKYHPWRPGDQRVFISDIRRAKSALGWQPKISPPKGIRLLFDWISVNPGLFQLQN